MEDVLDVYEMPYDPAYPTVCFDEKPKQLIAETRVPCPTMPGQSARYDYEYERNGTVTCSYSLNHCEPGGMSTSLTVGLAMIGPMP
jgi:hypothetical protein